MIKRLLDTRADGWTLLIRLMVGLVVFVPEGLQKPIFPSILGAGRFAKIGLPWPGFLGAFVGVFELACGLLIVLGLLTRLACIPLLVVMVVAIVSTKLLMWLGRDLGMFHVAKFARYGFWSMAHEARNDFCMLLGCVYLLIEGGGRWSLDARLAGRRTIGRPTRSAMA